MLGTDRLADVVRGRGKSIVYLSTALALAGGGTASAATIGSSSTPMAAAPITTAAATTATTPIAATTTSANVPLAFAGHRQPTALAVGAASHQTAGSHAAAHSVAAWQHRPERLTFHMVQEQLNWQTNPRLAAKGIIPAADRLLPVPTSGPQQFIPIGGAQYQNAETIVQQALAQRMGIRSAVIAVATAIQESQLININYGTGDSLGLFQQQADCGWGSPQQIMDPAYAANAFLAALRGYQASNPDWATQPLYQAAQGVQASAFPYAYGQWEIQAAQLVSQIAMQIR